MSIGAQRHFVIGTSSLSVAGEEAGVWLPTVSLLMKRIYDMAAQIAPTNIPVLLCGESGTGKGVLARHIHNLSRHFAEPLDTIACAWMSKGRIADHFVQCSAPVEDGPSAKTGTLFLRELSDLDAASQSALLRAVRDVETEPTSGTIAPRLISSTTRDLPNEIRRGRFQNELYRRLSGICLHLLPLRERKEDLPALVQFLLAKHAARFHRSRPSLRTESLEAFFHYPWSGNIRELENVILRVLVLEDEELVISDLQSAFASALAETAVPRPHPTRGAAPPLEAGREPTLEALTRTASDRKRAAPAVQVGCRSLLHKVKQNGFEQN